MFRKQPEQPVRPCRMKDLEFGSVMPDGTLYVGEVGDGSRCLTMLPPTTVFNAGWYEAKHVLLRNLSRGKNPGPYLADARLPTIAEFEWLRPLLHDTYLLTTSPFVEKFGMGAYWTSESRHEKWAFTMTPGLGAPPRWRSKEQDTPAHSSCARRRSFDRRCRAHGLRDDRRRPDDILSHHRPAVKSMAMPYDYILSEIKRGHGRECRTLVLSFAAHKDYRVCAI